MSDKVDDGCIELKTVLLRTKRHRVSNHGEEHRKGQSVPGRRWDTERLRGVTPVLVLRHGGRLRATLKSTAGEPAVLFAIAQGRIWNRWQSTCQICQIPMQKHSRSECHPSEPFCVPASPRYALPLAMLFAVVSSSMTLGHNKK